MISLQQMRYLVILSEELQFSRASERCFVTQPTLSMQVKKAEEQLGYAVFDRALSPLSLTPYGIEVIPILREILSENDNLRLLNDRMAGKIKEEIRVGIIPTGSVYILTRLFLLFKQALPNVRFLYVEHPTETLLQELEKGTIDFGILAGCRKDTILQITGRSNRILIAGNIAILQILAGAAVGPIKVSDWCALMKISQAGEELIFIIAIN